MPAAGYVTLIGIGATVVVLAGYLLAITMILVHVNFTLGTVIAGVRAIANQTQPLGMVIGEINNDLAGVQGAIDGLVAKATRAKGRR